MNYKHLLLLSLLGLAACDGSDSTISKTDTSGTFADFSAAQGQLSELEASIAANIAKKATTESELKALADKVIAGAGALIRTGQDDAAIEALKQAGLLQAASKVEETRQAAILMAGAGLQEEAYLLYAPDDFVLNDPTAYNYHPDGSLAAAVDERPAVKHHNMQIDGKTIWYTASAGHLTAFAKNPQKEDPQASIFYTAYTRDDLPTNNRPVTFFFNGGPGASSMYLHLAAFAPIRAFVDGRNVKPEWTKAPPQDFPLIDNTESLLGKSDLVFVDMVGSGFSEAIAPKTNKSFWGTDVDVGIARDFIIRYINANKRQGSPKYLYGESYGGGIRVPKLAHALYEAGTGVYEKPDTDLKPTILSGVVFHSPAFDYGADDREGLFPTLAMVADYLKVSTARGNMPTDEYVEKLRQFAAANYDASPFTYLKSDADLDPYLGPVFYYYPSLSYLAGNYWAPGYDFNAYDARTHIKLDTDSDGNPISLPYDFNFYDDVALQKDMTTYLPSFVNYKSSSQYVAASWAADWNDNESLASELWEDNGVIRNGLPDIVATLGYDPTIKLLTVHGYYDTVTPFYRSELSLKGVVLDEKTGTTLLDRIPVKSFEGGHMIYYSEEARVPLIKTLEKFYDDPPYGGSKPAATPPVIAATTLPASLSAPAIARH